MKELRRYEIHVVVAAMNSDLDACTFTPALVPTAITVGASNITDSMAFFSNYGSCLDLSAPGTDIGSVCVAKDCESNTGIIYTDGTSVAAPHVSGAVALWLSQFATSYTTLPASVAAVSTAVQCTAIAGRLKLKDAESPNLLLQIPPQTESLSDAYASCSLLSTSCPLGSNGMMCSGQGICFAGGVCRCDTYWEGTACDQSINVCSVSCGDHGTCVFDFCECESGWFGIQCDLQCEGDGGVICSGHGTCSNNADSCTCDTEWTGDICDSTCADVDGVVCSGHGICVSGECKCDALYFGSMCETYDTSYLTDSYCCDGLHLYDWTTNPFLTIAMFWTDLNPSDPASGGVYAGQVNDTTFAVVFDSVVLTGTSCSITMELLLHSNGDFDLAIVDNDIGTSSGCEGYEYYYGPASYYAWVVVGIKSAYDRGVLEYDELIPRQWNNLPESVHYQYTKIIFPTGIPTSIPTTSSPTLSPMTSSPTVPGETNRPTTIPTLRPTRSPTSKPTARPSTQPTYKPTSSPSLVPSPNPTAAPTPKPTRVPTRLPTAVPSRQPTRLPTRFPTLRPTISPTVKSTIRPTGAENNHTSSQNLTFCIFEIAAEYYYTNVVFDTTVRVEGLDVSDMDTGAQTGFTLVCADSIDGASNNDILITGITIPPSRSGLSHNTASVADKAVEISFSTRLILENSLYPTPESLVAARQSELTLALSKASTLELFINYCVQYGSVTVTLATEVLFDPPTYDDTITVIFTSPSPTPAPVVKEKTNNSPNKTAGMTQTQFTIIIILAVILGCILCVLFGLAIYFLGWKPRPRERAWNRAIAASKPPPSLPVFVPPTKAGYKWKRVRVQQNQGTLSPLDVDVEVDDNELELYQETL